MGDNAAIATGAGLSIVVNPSAGADEDGDAVKTLRAAFPEAEFHQPEADGLGLALEHAARSDVIGIVGGDGSINAAAERALQSGRPLAIVPGGTLNHFARDLGVADVHDTVTTLRAGSRRKIDVGMIAGRPFLNTASFGSYPELVDARERLEKRIGKWPAMAVALARVLPRMQPTQVWLDGVEVRIWTIFIGNCEYGPAGFAPRFRERLDDGLLDVRYAEGGRRFSRTRLALAALTGRLEHCTVFRRRLVSSLEIRSAEGPLRLARDGETFDGGTTVMVTKRPRGLEVYAPAVATARAAAS